MLGTIRISTNCPRYNLYEYLGTIYTFYTVQYGYDNYNFGKGCNNLPKILTEKDIKNVLRSIKTLSESNVMETIKAGGLKPVNLGNGYRATLTMDVLKEDRRLLHLSVSKLKGHTDIDIAQKIADDIIGEGNAMIGPVHLKNVLHFMKVEDESTMVELMKDINTKL